MDSRFTIDDSRKIINMKNLKELEVWFVTGSQHLYGEETLKKVAEHSQTIAKSLNDTNKFPYRLFINQR